MTCCPVHLRPLVAAMLAGLAASAVAQTPPPAQPAAASGDGLSLDTVIVTGTGTHL